MKQPLTENKVRRSFSRFAHSYNNWAIPQKLSAEILSQSSEILPPNSICLDAGCGTGLFSKEYLQAYPDIKLIGIDFSQDMLNEYQKLNPHFFLEDIEQLTFQDNYFYSCFSNFTLHWTSLEKSIKEAFRVTNHYFSFAIPVKGSLKLLPFHFPEQFYLIELIERLKGKIKKSEVIDIEIPFMGMELLKYFHYTGTITPNSSGLKGKQFLKEWVEKLEKEKSYYKVLFIQGYL